MVTLERFDSVSEVNRAARTVEVRIRYADGIAAAASRTPARASALDNEIFAVAESLLGRLFTRRVRLSLVGLTLSRFAPLEVGQLDLLDPAGQERARSLTTGLDAVRDRYGHGSLVSGRSLHLLGQLAEDRHKHPGRFRHQNTDSAGLPAFLLHG